jgi:glycosyltransferase involved in cell wall biosynthesis
MSRLSSEATAIIFWGPHSRHAVDIAEHLGGTLHLVHVNGMSWRRFSFLAPLKYLLQTLQTWAILLRRRPAAVYVIITPTFAALAVYLYSLLTGVPFVMSVHGHSLTSRKWAWTIPLQKFLARRALKTVVNEPEYARIFSGWGARVVVLERCPIRRAPVRVVAPQPGRFLVTMVSIFAVDEPVDLVVEAARQLPEVEFAILGDPQRAAPGLVEGAPANVRFPGYLSGDEYWDLLRSSNAVLTLTSEPLSLVSGGVESMALGRPTIVSRQETLVEYFTKGAVFIDHTVESVVSGVTEARAREEQLTAEIRQLADEKQRRWLKAVEDLRNEIVTRGAKASPSLH